jgi:hypothetical protein
VRWLSQAIEAFRQALIVYTREHHHIEQQNKFSPYRSWLSRFFSEVQGKNRDDILKAVREAQAQFPAPNSNQRK